MTAATRLLSDSPWAGGPSDLAVDFGAIDALPPAYILAAQRQVALHGGDDVAELLAMLGIGAP